MRDLTRRTFLGGSALGLAAFALPWRPLRAEGVRKKKVIVAGAGLAGLAAAWELREAGHEVIVLEARTRPGGRVYTVREPLSDGLHVEAGASAVPGHHDHTMRYLGIAGVSLVSESGARPQGGFVRLFRGQRTVAYPGKPPEPPPGLRADERALPPGGLWKKYIGDALPEMGENVRAREWPPPALAAKYEKMTFADFLRARGASDEAVSLLRRGFLDGWGDGVDAASALVVLRDVADRVAGRSYFHIVGGADTFPRALAARLGDRIHYGAEIARIEHDARGVRVTARTSSGESAALAGDYLVCTLPFSVLRHIEVSPRWSPAKQRAVDELPYTSVARPFVQYRTRFWTARGLAGGALTDRPIMWLFDDTSAQPGPRGVLSAYVSGAHARTVTNLDAAARRAFTLDEIERIHPGARDQVEAFTSVCWDAEPHSRGAYMWLKPGQLTSLWPAVVAPEGRVHFAGEHASTAPGWMQGALESGARAAQQIHAAP